MKHLFNKVLATICFLAGAVGVAMADNYPSYRSDYLWTTVPDHADWLYRTGENASVEVQLSRYGIPLDCKVDYEIGDDCLPGDVKGSVLLKGGKAVIRMGTRRTPGFRDLRLRSCVDGAVYTHHIKLGFGVEKIEPYTREPEDFQQFWQTAAEEASKYPLNYTLEPAPEYSTSKVECSLLRLETDRSHCVYAYLFKPRGAAPGSCPAVLCPPGAGVKTIKGPERHIYYAERGCIRLEMEIHGLDPRMSERSFKELQAIFGDYLQKGIESRDRYYMKRVYLSLVRAIDFLTSLPEWDGRNVAVQGGSQGGALSLVAAGLDPRVTLCCANHPALSDMAGYFEKGRTGGYPHFNRVPGFLTEQAVETLAYFDVVNFARHITCPVRMTWGYNDNVCPPTTSYAVWNTLSCPKEALITPINEHWTTDETERAHCDWILNNLK